MAKDVVTYGEGKQVVEYGTPVPEERKPAPSARNSTAVMMEAKVGPEEAAIIARDQYEQLEATGTSREVEELEYADSETLRGEALADEMAAFDPNSGDADAALATMQYISNADIAGDAFSFTLPRLFVDLKSDDNFNRLDGINDEAIANRQEFVTRLDSSELDYKEQAQINIQRRARERAAKGASVQEVFETLSQGAEQADDALDTGFARDLMYMMLPFVAQANLEASFEEWTGRDIPLEEALFMGEVVNKMKQELVNTPPELREERALELQRLIKKHSGVNGVIADYVPESLRGFVQEIAESDSEAYLNLLAASDTTFLTSDNDWGRWLDNAFTVIDAATLGYSKKLRDIAGGARRFFSVSKGEGATALRAMAVTDDAPKASEILSLGATDSTGRINKGIGMSEEDHVGALLPNPKGDGYDLLPDYTKQVIARNEELTGEVTGRRTRRSFFNNDEEQLVRETVDKFNLNTGGGLQPTRSQIGEISENGDEFEYIAQFGASEDRGFRTVEQAEEFVGQYLGKDADVDILKWDAATGRYYTVRPSAASKKKAADISQVGGFSVIREETGVPISTKAYHGTSASEDFTEFVPGGSSKGMNAGRSEEVYFTDNPDVAHYATGSVEPPLENPALIEGARVLINRISIDNPLVLDARGQHVTNSIDKIREYALAAGHDGVVVKNASTPFADGTEYILFKGDVAPWFEVTPTRPPSGGPTSGVEYVARYNTKLRFVDEAAGEFDPMAGAYAGLVKNNWLANPASKMDSQIRFAATRAVDDASFVQQKLTDIHRPFTKLKRKDQRVVIDIENAGAKAAKDYSPRELMSMKIDGKPLTAKQIAGYYSRLQTRRALWEVENKALYEKMQAKGMRQVEAEGFRHAGKVIPVESLKPTTWAYSPVGKKVDSYTKADLEALYHNGGSVVELWRPITIGEHQVSRVVVDGSAVTLSELPRSVLRYVPGYQPRYYNARWFVRKRTTMRVDGELRESDIPVAASAEYKDAAAMVSRQSNPDDFVVDMDRVAANGLADSESLNWELDNMMFYNSRSDQEIAALGDHNIIVDPQEALRRSISTVSNTLGQGRLREVLMSKFRNTYAEVLPTDKRGNPIYPERKSDIKAPAPGNTEAFRKWREARAMHDYIRIMGQGLDPTQKTYRNIMMNVAAAMEKQGTWGSQAIARAVYGATEEFSPTAIARTAAFTTQILAAPIRQAWIQSHQALFLTGIDPVLTPRAFFTDGFYLDSAFALERAGVHDRPWAKKFLRTLVAGQSDEQKALYKNFAASGMPYLRSALVVEGVTEKVPHVIGELGFAAGERHNLSATYAFAYRKYLKDTGKKWQGLTDKDWEQIAFKTREYALNMTRADAFNYQHGLFSAATQYLAIRHKAVNAVLTSKEFTTAERNRILAGQLFLFGIEGSGIGLLVSSITDNMGLTYEDIPALNMTAEQSKQAIEGGIYDLLMNQTLQVMMDQEAESNVQFARNMAALGEADRFVATLFSGMDSVDLMEFAAGPSASVYSSTKRAMMEVNALLHSDLSTEDKVISSVESILSVFSQGNNLLKTKVGAAMSMAVDTKGRPIAEITDVDRVARRYFGFGTAQENEYYENMSTLYGDPSKNQDTLDEAAEILANLIRRETMQGNWKKAQEISGAFFTLWPDQFEKAAIQELLSSKLSEPSVANQEMYKKLVQDWSILSQDELATKLENDSYLLRNEREREKLRVFVEEAKARGTTDE